MTAKSLWPMLKQTCADWSEDKALRLAAALALYTILSLGPLLVLTIKIVAMTMEPATAQQQVQSQMGQLIGSSGAKAIGDMVAKALDPGAGVLAAIVSSIILLFTASGVFGELQDSMNTIWEVKPKPNLGILTTIKNRVFSMGMVLAIAFLLLVSMFVSTVLGQVTDKITGNTKTEAPQTQSPPPGQEATRPEAQPDAGQAGAEGQPSEQPKEQAPPKEDKITVAQVLSYLLDFSISIAVMWVLFMLIFRFVPDVKVAWSDVWKGALVTAVLIKIGQYLLALYFNYGSTTSAYGAAGSLVAVMLWAYYSAAILFFGAEFTQVYAKSRGHEIEPSKDAVKITEEDRSQQGIPSKEHVEEKAGQRPAAGRPGPYRAPRPAGARPATPAAMFASLTSGLDVDKKGYLLAGAGLVVGAIAGGLGALGVYQNRRAPTRSQLAAVRLDQRLKDIETKVGRASRVKQYLGDVDMNDRIRALQKRIREAHVGARSAATGRPKWMVKAADVLAGK